LVAQPSKLGALAPEKSEDPKLCHFRLGPGVPLSRGVTYGGDRNGRCQEKERRRRLSSAQAESVGCLLEKPLRVPLAPGYPLDTEGI